MDRFMEQVVVKKQRGLNEVLYVLAMISMVLFALLGMMYLQMLFYAFSVPALVITVILLGGAVLLFLYRDRLRAEYEYTFTNGDVDFAMVFNNQKRKSLGSLKVTRVDAFGMCPCPASSGTTGSSTAARSCITAISRRTTTSASSSSSLMRKWCPTSSSICPAARGRSKAGRNHGSLS